ncbi:MAG: ketoacyl-ACP synthase III [Deltaproteobacteria bacterium]|jgi:3-oxoacyl-[acyl-carrier-protein] synthase-3|nr:ketoacyl-ACP synthase III [Deltaproteobacteria bacterium]
MAITKVSNIRLAGIVGAVPEPVRTVQDCTEYFDEKEVLKISQSTGVKRWHVAPSHVCVSDLCHTATERLLAELDWSRDSIDLLIFISQGPDYILPATGCILQSRLGLSKQCAAFDINLGCSGYVYGLWLIAHMLSSGKLNRALLLVGDTASKTVSHLDRSAALLFGDAGAATAIERCEEERSMTFVFGTDGTGAKNLIIPAGGFRYRRNKSSGIPKERENGNIRSDEQLFMDGAEIFAFTLREVSPMLKTVLKEAVWSADDVDAFVFHQANKFIIEYLAKRMKLPIEKVPMSLENYGNTSSASIPLTMVHTLSDKLRNESLKIVMAGFGVGYSWGACTLSCGPMVMPEIIILPENKKETDMKGQ